MQYLHYEDPAEQRNEHKVDKDKRAERVHQGVHRVRPRVKRSALQDEQEGAADVVEALEIVVDVGVKVGAGTARGAERRVIGNATTALAARLSAAAF